MNRQRTKYWIEYRKRRSIAVVYADRCLDIDRTEGASEYSSLEHVMHEAVNATRIEVHLCCPKKPGLWLWAWGVMKGVPKPNVRSANLTKAEGRRRCDSCFRMETIVRSAVVGKSNRVYLCNYCWKNLITEGDVTVVTTPSTPPVEVSGGLPGTNRRH